MRRPVLTLLPLGLLLLAVAEIATFVAMVHWIGALWSILALAAASVLGLALLRREGIKGWRAFRAAAEAGTPPGEQVTNSLIGLLGALLLAVPGFITGVAGLLLVLPPVRTFARLGARRLAERRISSAVAGDLFGPRRVRVRPGAPVHPDTSPSPSQQPSQQPSRPAAIRAEVVDGVVEGEIVR